jgi:hypothetical protein
VLALVGAHILDSLLLALREHGTDFVQAELVVLPGFRPDRSPAMKTSTWLLPIGAVCRLQNASALASDLLADDRISEDDPARGDVEFADLGLVGAAARLEDRHRAQQS